MKYLELLIVLVLTSTIGSLNATQEEDTSVSDSLDVIDSTLSNLQTSNEVDDIGSQNAAHPARRVSLDMGFQELPSEVRKMMETIHKDSFPQTSSRPVKVEDIVVETLAPLRDNFQESNYLEKLAIELSILDESDNVQSEEPFALEHLETQKERINSQISSELEDTPDPNKKWTTNHVVVPHAALRLIRESGMQTTSGNFDFGSLPTQPEILSILEYSDDVVQTFYNLVRSFVNTVLPDPLPYEIIIPQLTTLTDGLLGGSSTNMPFDGSGSGGDMMIISKRQADNPLELIQEPLTQFASYLIPVLVVFGIGIVLALLFPVFGCCFCCCRCCGKCGAKHYKYQSKHECAKCTVLSIIFLTANLLLLIGVVLGFLSNDKLSSAIKSYTGTINNAITDTVNYVNGTVSEVVFLADDGLDAVLDAALSDVQNAGTVLGDPLETSLQGELASFLSSTDQLLNNLESVQQDLLGVNESISQLSTLSTQLNDSVTLLQESLSLSNLTALCGGNMTCMNAIPQLHGVDTSLQFAEVAGVNSALTALQSLDVNGTRALVNGSTSFLGNLSGLIDEQLSGFDLPLNVSQFDSVTSTVSTVQGTVDQILNSNGTVGQIRDVVDQADMYIELAERYRYIVFAVLLVAIFLIWVLFTVGLVCGVFGYSRKALPYERSAVSNCGARLFLVGIAICFLTCGLLLILSSLMYLLSSVTQKLCNDLAPSEYTLVQRLADDPQVWDGNTLIGRIIGSQAGVSANNISLSEVLRQCEQNEPLYSALQADSFFDIDSLLSNVTNLTNQIDLGSTDFSSLVNFTSADFIPVSIRTDLQNIETDINNNFNLSNFDQFLNTSSRSNFDLQEVYDNLTLLAQMMPNATAQNETLAIRDNLVGMTISNTVQAIQQELSVLRVYVDNLEAKTVMISPQVTQVFNKLDNFLNNTGNIINTEAAAFVDQLIGYFTGYIDFVLNSVRNEVGRCQPLAAAYGGVHNAVCVETIDGVNGFWFSIGWCVLFLVPMVISTAILTTYLRKSPEDVHSFVEEGNLGTDGEVISNSQVVTTGYRSQQVRGSQLPNTPNRGW